MNGGEWVMRFLGWFGIALETGVGLKIEFLD